jgi:hypothetical protein
MVIQYYIPFGVSVWLFKKKYFFIENILKFVFLFTTKPAPPVTERCALTLLSSDLCHLNLTNNSMNTSLQVFAQFYVGTNYETILNKMLEKGADVSRTNKNGSG